MGSLLRPQPGAILGVRADGSADAGFPTAPWQMAKFVRLEPSNSSLP